MTDADANRALISDAYGAFARGDIPSALKALSEDILWHVPGRGPLSRDYHGHEQVLEFIQHFMELSAGTFQIRVDDVLAKDDRVIALVTESAQRKGRTWSSPQVHAWTVKNGQAAGSLRAPDVACDLARRHRTAGRCPAVGPRSALVTLVTSGG